ncbi:hypothetical protein M3Y99_00207500 [Aphelenchoides fujianensis]|nr:hypothetical protein M3Y99_00207500 [Aphelenchoides fujianensis]
MRPPTNIAEWQLQAVLFKARLVQYFDVFISQGGDDVDQLMASDQDEFLEIMSLVGMSSKPLHVRRLQRTLVEFSRDRLTFLHAAIPQIGPPPLGPDFTTTPTMEQLAEVLRFLVPAPPPLLSVRAPVQPTASSSSLAARPPARLHRTAALVVAGGLVGRVALAGLRGDRRAVRRAASSADAHLSRPPLRRPAVHSSGLTDAEVGRLQAFAVHALSTEPPVEPRTSRRKPNRDLVETLALPVDHPQRAARFRQLAAIYGRSGARRPHKSLTNHEAAVNEAAAQLCLLQPAYLTRRDELFALARRVVRSAGFPRTMRAEEAEQEERSTTPTSLASTPPPAKRRRSEDKSPPPPPAAASATS